MRRKGGWQISWRLTRRCATALPACALWRINPSSNRPLRRRLQRYRPDCHGSGNRLQLPEPVEHVGRIELRSYRLNSPHENWRAGAGQPLCYFAFKLPQIAAAEALHRGAAFSQIAANVERAYPSIVVGSEQYAAALVGRKVVHARSRHGVERHFLRIRKIGNVHHVDVAFRRRSHRPGPLFTDERVAPGTVDLVMEPPDVMRLATDSPHVAEENGVRDGTALSTASDVEDRHALGP